MKTSRRLILVGMASALISAHCTVMADPTAPAPGVESPHNDSSGLPSDIKTLITDFNHTRDTCLAAQIGLLAQLKKTAAPVAREQIRTRLQTNRQTFMTEQKKFRAQLQEDLHALKGKISHEQFLQIMEAAHNPASVDGPQLNKPR